MSGRFVSVVSLFCEENENHKDTMTTVSVATTIATLATRLLLQLLWCFAGMIRRFVSFHHVYSFRHHLDIVAQENVGICSEIFCPCYCDVSCRCCRHWTWLGQKNWEMLRKLSCSMQCTMEIADAPATRSFAHAGPDGHVSIYKLVSVP